MSKQTKLTKEQKTWLKEVRENHPDTFKVFHSPADRVTIGVKYTPGHNAARVYVSIASPDETKFRKKVGEYNVREALDIYLDSGIQTGIPVYVPIDQRKLADAHEVIAESLFETVGIPLWEA